MPGKHKRMGRAKGIRTTKAPLAAGALALLILLMTVGNVASAQAGTANIVAANTVQSILSPIAADASKPSPRRVIAIPQKPALRSPYQPPSWTPGKPDWVPGPPPWAPGQPDWVPGPPPWASNNVDKALSPKSVKAKQ